MKLTIWQFLALVAALVGGYLIWTTWGAKQDQGGMIQNWNNSITGSEKRVSTTKQTTGAEGGEADAPPAKNVW